MIVSYDEDKLRQTGYFEINGFRYGYAFFNLHADTRYGYWGMGGQVRATSPFKRCDSMELEG